MGLLEFALYIEIQYRTLLQSSIECTRYTRLG